MAQIREFETIDEEVAFWESNDSVDYWVEMEDVDFEVDLQTKSLYPKLAVLEREPEAAPNSQTEFEPITIEYVAHLEDHIVVIRDVPAYQSKRDGRRYVLEEILTQVAQLLVLESTNAVQPLDTLQVPVFSLKAAA